MRVPPLRPPVVPALPERVLRVPLCVRRAGSSDKDPSSHSCDRIVIHIKLPGAAIAEVDLNVTKQKIVVQSPE